MFLYTQYIYIYIIDIYIYISHNRSLLRMLLSRAYLRVGTPKGVVSKTGMSLGKHAISMVLYPAKLLISSCE